jgi:4-oxalocrotonate tautomerase family enzyme
VAVQEGEKPFKLLALARGHRLPLGAGHGRTLAGARWETYNDQGTRRVMPVIQCDIREGRTEEQKQALAKEITRVVHETIGAHVEYIYVLIRETPGSHHVKAGEKLEGYEPDSIA